MRPSIFAVVLGAFLSLGAKFQTPNFAVDAPTPELAQSIGQWAEHYRKAKAMEWLGQEMPNWPEPCPLKVKVSMNGSGGATSFAFDRGRILSQDMQIEGAVDRLVASVLPHEITHTVFAHYFRVPVPRWADEGGSVLSEDDIERARHDRLVREILQSPGRAIPLRRLFVMTQYPRDVMVLYAEGYSVTSFLVGKSNRTQFLAFVARGMRGDWDGACKQFYGYESVDALEADWLKYLRDNRQDRPTILANNPQPQQVASNLLASTTRTTAPPADPLEGTGRTVIRGQMPDESRAGWTTPGTRPGGGVGMPTSLPPTPPRVQFGVPKFGPDAEQPAAPVNLGTPSFGPGK